MEMQSRPLKEGWRKREGREKELEQGQEGRELGGRQGLTPNCSVNAMHCSSCWLQGSAEQSVRRLEAALAEAHSRIQELNLTLSRRRHDMDETRDRLMSECCPELHSLVVG
jgi:hypothetical protein